jgi:hypothetical protein
MKAPRVPELLTIVVLASAYGCGPDPEPAPQACTPTDGGVEHPNDCDAAVDSFDPYDVVV